MQTQNAYMVFDTETISLERPFIYNIGYVIFDENDNPIISRNMVISQIWDDKKLFASAYYGHKRPLYVSYMRGRTAKKIQWGHACRVMAHDMEKYGVNKAYAYNAPFDQKAFNYTGNHFKNLTRPLDRVEVVDILPMARQALRNNENYLKYCEATGNTYKNSKGKLSPRFSVQAVYPFLMSKEGYEEEHTALQDSRDEGTILQVIRKWGGQ